MPTVIVWTHGGAHVELEGSFDSWTQRYTMQRSGKDFTLVKLLPPGVYQVRAVALHAWAAWMGASSMGLTPTLMSPPHHPRPLLGSTSVGGECRRNPNLL